MEQKTCEERVDKYQDMVEISVLNAFTYFENPSLLDETDDDGEIISDEYDECREYEDIFDFLNNYGIAFDYVEPEFEEYDPRENYETDEYEKYENIKSGGYWRWQIAWGGPSYEFRFYMNHPEQEDYDSAQFWFLDWFDGAFRYAPFMGSRIWDHLSEWREYDG